MHDPSGRVVRPPPPGESETHRCAKLLVAAVVTRWKEGGAEAPRVVRECDTCGREESKPLPDRIETAAVEYGIGPWKADVALLCGEEVVAVVEVCHTHEVEADKAKDLRAREIRCAEVDATMILKDPHTWRPARELRRPFSCDECLSRRTLRGRMNASIRSREAARSEREWMRLDAFVIALALPVLRHPYWTEVSRCWKCRFYILIYAWAGHQPYSAESPPVSGTIKPWTVKHVKKKGTEYRYWSNTCPHCGMVQADWSVYGATGPFGWLLDCEPQDVRVLPFAAK